MALGLRLSRCVVWFDKFGVCMFKVWGYTVLRACTVLGFRVLEFRFYGLGVGWVCSF